LDNEKLYEAFLLILDHEQGDCKDLSALLRTVGRESTQSLLKVYEGRSISIPSKQSMESRLKFINGYIRYRHNHESWESVVESLYGPNATVKERRSLRDGIREVGKRCDRYGIDVSSVTSEEVEQFEREVGEELEIDSLHKES
jgi:hypothetical protein